MNRNFHCSVNSLSKEEAELWNRNHTIKEIYDNRQSLMNKVQEQIPKDELSEWLIAEEHGILDNTLHTVYISFKHSWLFTRKGRCRRISRALRMMGVPFVKVNYIVNGLEVADDGFEVVQIARLKGDE